MKWNSFIKLSEMHVNIFIHPILSEQIKFELQYSHTDKKKTEGCALRGERQVNVLAFSAHLSRWSFKENRNRAPSPDAPLHVFVNTAFNVLFAVKFQHMRKIAS